MQDMALKGRGNGDKIGGTLNVTARLTDMDVAAIRTDRRTERSLAAIYGVSHTTIGSVRRNLTYRKPEPWGR